MAASMGHQARFAMDADATFDASSYRFEPQSETLRKTRTVIDTNGIRGTRSHSKERTRFGLDEVGGQITVIPSKIDLDNWLPKILGAAESSDVFALAETLPEFFLLFDRIADIFLYSTCVVSQAVFHGEPGQPISLTMDVLAKSETGSQAWPGTVPALGTASSDAPYVMSDLSTLTLAGSSRAASCLSFDLTINNAAQRRYTNSTNPTALLITDRIVTLATTVEWSASSPNTTDLYNAALAGAAGSLVLANGIISTTFTLANLQAEDRGPHVASKGEIPLELFFTARKSGSTAEISVTNEDAA